MFCNTYYIIQTYRTVYIQFLYIYTIDETIIWLFFTCVLMFSEVRHNSTMFKVPNSNTILNRNRTKQFWLIHWTKFDSNEFREIHLFFFQDPNTLCIFGIQLDFERQTKKKIVFILILLTCRLCACVSLLFMLHCVFPFVVLFSLSLCILYSVFSLFTFRYLFFNSHTLYFFFITPNDSPSSVYAIRIEYSIPSSGSRHNLISPSADAVAINWFFVKNKKHPPTLFRVKKKETCMKKKKKKEFENPNHNTQYTGVGYNTQQLFLRGHQMDKIQNHKQYADYILSMETLVQCVHWPYSPMNFFFFRPPTTTHVIIFSISREREREIGFLFFLILIWIFFFLGSLLTTQASQYHHSSKKQQTCCSPVIH